MQEKVLFKLSGMKKSKLIDLFLTSKYAKNMILEGHFTKESYKKELCRSTRKRIVGMCYHQWENGYLKMS